MCRPLPVLALVCVLGWATHRTNLALEDRVQETTRGGHVGNLPDGKVLRVASLGFERLIADLYWLRTVNYIGDERMQKAGFPDAARLGELVTDIDPQFKTVYSVMNSLLTVLTRQPDAAIALLDKGIRHNDWWRLHFLQGFNYFFEKDDYQKAAEQMKLAAEKGGPPYLPLLASRLYAQAGDPETAMVLVQARLATAQTQDEREALQQRHRDLLITMHLRHINEAVDVYKARHGTPPSDVRTLVLAKLLPIAPLDPEGNTYRIENGFAVSQMAYEELSVYVNP